MKDYVFERLKNDKTGVKKDITLKDLLKAAQDTGSRALVIVELGLFITSGLALIGTAFISGARSFSRAELNAINDLDQLEDYLSHINREP